MGVMLGITPEDVADRGRSIEAAERKSLLLEIAASLKDGYLYEDKGNAFARKLEKAANGDRFAEAGTLGDFVRDVNAYLQEISNDKHLRLGYGPGMDDATGGPRRVVRSGPAPAGGEGHAAEAPHGKAVRRMGPGGGEGDFGFRETRVLDGNIGYLDLGMFAGSDAAREKTDEAMLALAGTDALIIDLGRNGGGGPWMVRYLSGFLFSEPTHLADTWARGMEKPAERWTLDGQPTDAFHDKPVYILTSNRTFSAAESFTFGLTINDRVTLVGQRTGGGGHFADDVQLSDELRLTVPRGRTYDPETGKGWEAEGIAPDIDVPYGEALERAAEEARRLVTARAGND